MWMVRARCSSLRRFSWTRPATRATTATASQAHIHNALGTHRAIWLSKGLWRDNFLNGTKGHVDIVACFAPDGRLLVHRQTNADHPDFPLWETLAEQFSDEGLEVLPLEAPLTLKDCRDWVDYSYINHYVCNGAVICPSFDDRRDDAARERLQDAYPGRDVRMLDARALFAMGRGHPLHHPATTKRSRLNPSILRAPFYQRSDAKPRPAMFTYINPDIRERLIRDGKLFRIDADGAEVEMTEAPGPGLHLNLMGPIPLPLARGQRHPIVQWYASVRSTELSEVEHLASTLREQGGQHLFSHLASSMAVNSVLVIGEPEKSDNPLVRVHSSCLTGDVLGSQKM